MIRTAVATCILLAACGGPLSAQDAVGWRTDGTGVYPDADPPTQWSPEQNVLWRTPLPDRSNAQPVPVGDRIFVCAEPFSLICLRADDGEILWQRTNTYRDVTTPQERDEIERELAVARPLRAQREMLAKQIETLRKAPPAERDAADRQIEALQAKTEELDARLEKLPLAARFTLPATQPQYNGFTTATPTSDGRRVWAVFGNRVVVCYDVQGKRLWSRVLPDDPQAMWGHSSSPLLVGDKLIVNMEHTVALDAETGEQVWFAKYGQCWGSSVRARVGDEDIIVLANGRMLRAADGKRLVRIPPLGNASSVVDGNTVYSIGFQAAARELPAAPGEPFELHERWVTNPKGSTFFASPIVVGGLVYTVSTERVLTVLDARDGSTVYARRLDLGRGPVWASLCAAGPYVYLSSRDGTTLVLRAGREYQEVARNTLDYFIATPVFVGKRMYVRTSDALVCIRESS